jgi:hypothetical protein
MPTIFIQKTRENAPGADHRCANRSIVAQVLNRVAMTGGEATLLHTIASAISQRPQEIV